MENDGRTNIDDFLTVRGFGGGYGGYGYGGGGQGHGGVYGTRESFNGTVDVALLNANRRENAQEHTAIIAQGRDNAVNARFTNIEKALCDARTEAATCCCENKAAIANSKAEVLTEIKNTTISGLQSELLACRTGNSNNGVMACIDALTKAIEGLSQGGGGGHK